MDTANELDRPELLEMHLDYDGGVTLQEAVRWSKFLAITGIAGMGLLLIAVIVFAPFAMEGYGQLTPDSARVVGILLLIVALYLAVLVTAAIILLRFSRLTKRGMNRQDQGMFNRGLKSLKVTFLILGLLSCLSLAAFILSLF
jgi:hypothetical protein